MVRTMKNSGIEWIGEIPENWMVERLARHLMEINEKNFPIKTTNVLSLTNKLGVIPYEDKGNQGNKAKENYEEYKIAYKDTIIANSMNILIGSVGYSNYYGCVSPVYYVFKEKPGNNLYFLNYIMQTPQFQKELRKYANGILEIRLRLSANDILKRMVAFPPNNEQEKIAALLDDKCEEIDEIITKTEQSIEEYKKLKQSVITKAVTKGIHSNRLMKDSGIEWIGKIPEDWDIKKIRYLFKLRDERNTLPLSEVNLISLYTDLGVIQHCDIEATTGNKAQNADGYKKVYNNDIVVNIILCWMGAVGRSAYDGVTSPAYDVYEPINNANSKFYHYYFRTKGFNGECYQAGKGIMLMRWRTYSEQFKAIKVLVPSPEEQEEIVKYLDEKCSEIDVLIEKKQQFLTELANYKKSLIYEYVTGKKEVA